MAAYISVPRDLTRVKSKVFLNLTKRQCICFGTAVLIGVPSFFLLREYGGNTLATLGMMILMLPLFFLAMYEKNGQPLEKFLNHYIQARFIRPKVRPYRTANYFALLQQQARVVARAAQTGKAAGSQKVTASGATKVKSGVNGVVTKGKEVVGGVAKGAAVFAKSHAHLLVIGSVLAMMLLLMLSAFSSCSILFGGTTYVMGQTTYTAEDEADLLALMEEEQEDAYNAEKEAAIQAELEKQQAEEEAKKAAEEAEAEAEAEEKDYRPGQQVSGRDRPWLAWLPAAASTFSSRKRRRNRRLRKA